MKFVYKTTERHRELQKKYRLERQAEGLCITSRAHGEATDGVLCAKCRAVHRRSH